MSSSSCLKLRGGFPVDVGTCFSLVFEVGGQPNPRTELIGRLSTSSLSVHRWGRRGVATFSGTEIGAEKVDRLFEADHLVPELDRRCLKVTQDVPQGRHVGAELAYVHPEGP